MAIEKKNLLYPRYYDKERNYSCVILIKKGILFITRIIICFLLLNRAYNTGPSLI